MKKKAVVLSLVGAMALGTCTVSAANGTRNISATFRNIKIVVDGKQVSTSAEPFIYNGTTYLPIRAVGEAVGKEVTWNAETNTVYLGEAPASAQQQSTTPAPETSVPAAASDLPILVQYGGDSLGLTSKEISEVFAAVRSGDESAIALMSLYYNFIDDILYDNPQLARDAYAEALSMFDSFTNNPNSARAKEWLEDMWEMEFQWVLS